MPRQIQTLAETLAKGAPLTLTQCAEFLQISTRQVERLAKQGMPFFLIGKRSPRFVVADIQHWLTTTRPALERQSNGLHVKERREQRLHS